MEFPFETFDVKDIIKIQKIGSGQYSKVYKIREKHTGRIFAAKILNDPYEDPKSKEFLKLKDEIEIISKLKHPAIVRFVGFSPINLKNEKKPIIITEYVPNNSLETILMKEQEGNSDEKWDDTHKLIVIYGIASAMMYLHDNGIIHRDLKPANILMGENLYPKIADFGLSKNTNKIDKSIKDIKGTPKYMAPEVYDFAYTNKCDVYSFSFIVFEILQGLENIDSKELTQRVYHQKRPKIQENIPSSYRQLIEQCWEHDPQKRPNFIEIVDRLENDGGFITPTMDESEYYQYQDYIKNKAIEEILKNNDTTVSVTRYASQCKLFIKKSALEMQQIDEISEDKIYNQALQFYNGITVSVDKQKAANLFKQSADNGNSESMTKYAEMLLKGDGISPHKSEAIEYFKKAIEKGNTTAMVQYADLLFEENKKEEAVDLYELAAENENLEGMKKYADKLFNGEGIEINKYRSIQIYKKAADLGHRDSIIRLFSILNQENINLTDSLNYIKKAADLGEIDAINKYADLLIASNSGRQNEAMNYYKRAINKGSSYAMYKYGKILYNGLYDIKKDEEKGADYYQMAIRKGQIDATFEYGQILYKNDRIESARYFKKAADNGHLESMKFYAKMLKEGDGIGKNIENSNFYYKMAADKGDIESMYVYACNLNEGIGGKSDISEAAKYFEKAALNGHFDSMIKAGELFGHDDHDFKDYEKAARLYQLAINVSEDKSYRAMNNLALLYENGKGVPQNLNQALFYFKLAADHNDLEAINNYARFLFNGITVDENKKKAAFYYKMAADQGYPPSMNNYANMLYNGIGIEIDKKLSYEYYYKSAICGNKYACYNYALLIEKDEIDDSNLNKNDEVKKFLKMAADKGHKFAAIRLAFLLSNEINDSNEDQKCIKEEMLKYFKIAADAGHAESMFQYGKCTYLGIGTDVDQVEGFIYLKKAFENGSKNAASFLQCIEYDKSCYIC